MTSAELARVTEVTNMRQFEIENDDSSTPVIVTYFVDMKKLYCGKHRRFDGCTCTLRVQASGLLTNSVIPDVAKHRSPKVEARQ